MVIYAHMFIHCSFVHICAYSIICFLSIDFYRFTYLLTYLFVQKYLFTQTLHISIAVSYFLCLLLYSMTYTVAKPGSKRTRKRPRGPGPSSGGHPSAPAARGGPCCPVGVRQMMEAQIRKRVTDQKK